MKFITTYCLCGFILLLGCNDTTQLQNNNTYIVPNGFPALPFPASNSYNDAKAELGRYLFYDKQLSIDYNIACSNCHYQKFGFADTATVSIGVSQEIGTRNSPAIINTGWNGVWFWDGRATTLEAQILGAMTSPREMYADTVVISQRLQKDTTYSRMFKSAFTSTTIPSTGLAVDAIATFCRTLISGNSRYDQYTNGDKSMLSAQELRGLQLFNSESTQCSSCHSGFNFTDNQFHSLGLHTHYYDQGRYNVTGLDSDIGRFKTPTLRNIELTAPYMNEGLFTTLEQVIEHYNSGGKVFRNKDSRIKPLNLTPQEKTDLIAFLKTLTDDSFINNTKFYNPR